jgi:hypothetical protein
MFAAVNVDCVMSSENVAVTPAVTATAVAPLTGLVTTTVGAVASLQLTFALTQSA